MGSVRPGSNEEKHQIGKVVANIFHLAIWAILENAKRIQVEKKKKKKRPICKKRWQIIFFTKIQSSCSCASAVHIVPFPTEASNQPGPWGGQCLCGGHQACRALPAGLQSSPEHCRPSELCTPICTFYTPL